MGVVKVLLAVYDEDDSTSTMDIIIIIIHVSIDKVTKLLNRYLAHLSILLVVVLLVGTGTMVTGRFIGTDRKGNECADRHQLHGIFAGMIALERLRVVFS